MNVLISSSFLTSFIAVHFSLHLHYLLAEFLFLLEILTQNSLNGNFIIIKHTDSKLFINQRGLLTPIPLNMLYILYWIWTLPFCDFIKILALFIEGQTYLLPKSDMYQGCSKGQKSGRRLLICQNLGGQRPPPSPGLPPCCMPVYILWFRCSDHLERFYEKKTLSYSHEIQIQIIM